MTKKHFLLITLLLALIPSVLAENINFQAFLNQHDMTWDRTPHRWEVAPYSGNGNVGFLFYQGKKEAKNIISIHAGRHDYYDHRLPDKGNQQLWIYRGRLPLGRFQIESKGDIISTDLRMDLWNAEMRGSVTTALGEYKVRAFTHSLKDVVYFDIDAGKNESISIKWIAERPISSVWHTITNGGGPKGGVWDDMRKAPYPMAPDAEFGENDTTEFCRQILHQHRGETTTAWKTQGEKDGKQTLRFSTHHSFPQKNSLAISQKNLAQSPADYDLAFKDHQAWWHDYYQQSFLTIDDKEKEAFYWIQMYKLGSAMRENGPILDLMGPWYHYTFWPMVWGDLNVQLIYWTHLTSNHLSLGESLPNNLDKYADNLRKNVPENWKDSISLGTCFPQDCLAYNHNKTPDMLAWIMHNYWLHCKFAGDDQRLKNKSFPLLKQTMNSYLNFFKENPSVNADGTINIRISWSPEYPAPWSKNVNFSLGLVKWMTQTLLELNEQFQLNDPLASEWRHINQNLVPFQTDENGLRISQDTPFEKPHRHYSHLLPFYPLALITPDNDKDKALLRKSVDHWLKVTESKTKIQAMAVTGYTATGAASMYACLGDAAKAYEYLDMLIKHKNVSPTTMYAEGNPVIESPLSFTTSLHDMLLQSWGDTIRVFPASPERWKNVAFDQLRTQGAFLVTAQRKNNQTQFIKIKSLAGKPCRIQCDIANPQFFINGKKLSSSQVERLKNKSYKIDLQKNQQVIILPAGSKLTDAKLVLEKNNNPSLFGFSKATERLPGHQFYSK
ncbi:hypothetical protein PQO03_16280 [Lentisphaera profundi]|uniref:Alpha-L-fucosidase n=1 Tax=Lentisphaera profundi TaxID=1658616 RepID=A0ABY7VYS4_9BACT|nr:hypothetical protein [Lentisphaera profundi]WDE99395.1 hypothetical protein PQO03_16280 [Lentisphaera profundi]